MTEETKRCKKCSDLIGDLEYRLGLWRKAGDNVYLHLSMYAPDLFRKLVELDEIDDPMGLAKPPDYPDAEQFKHYGEKLWTK